MKIIIYVLLFCSCFIANAQLELQVFTAKEGSVRAKDEALDKVPNPKLRAIGTLNQNIEGMQLSLDLATGKSNMWAYVFHDDELDSNVIIPLVKIPLFGLVNVSTFLGENALPLDAFASFIPNSNLASDTWIDSEVSAPAVLASTDYQQLSAADDGSDLQFVGMGTNELSIVDGLVEGKVYWSYLFVSQSGTFSCFSDAEDGNTFCVDGFTSVPDPEYSQEFDIYPVPMDRILSIVPKGNTEPFTMTFYDFTGARIMEKYSAGEAAAINGDELTAKTSILIITKGTKNYMAKIVR